MDSRPHPYHRARVRGHTKQTCRGCRYRKKKCDGVHPSCTPCQNWNVVCEYDARPAYVVLDNALSGRSSTVSWDQGLPTIADMPSHEHVMELVDIFFGRFSRLIPCFHEAKMRGAFDKGVVQMEAPVLAYAIFAIAAPHHPDTIVKGQAENWQNNAKLSYDLTGRHNKRTLWVLQAAVCILFHSFTTMRSSTTWLFVAKAWRQACWAGFNRVDSDLEPLIRDVPAAASAVEREEWRRTMWMFFVLDRIFSYNTGHPPAIDERHFIVNLPLPDATFYAQEEMIPVEGSNVHSPASMKAECLASLISTRLRPAGSFQQLVIAYVVLGQVTSHVYVLETPEDPEQHQREWRSLQLLLQTACSCLPLLDESPRVQPQDDVFNRVWLHVVMQTATILLHHLAPPSSTTTASNPPPLTAEDAEIVKFRLQKCQESAASVMDIFRNSFALDTQRATIMNPYIATGVYMSAHVLTLLWHETQDVNTRADIDVALGVFDCLRSEFPNLAETYFRGTVFGLGSSKEELSQYKGFKGLFSFCRSHDEHPSQT